MADYKFIFKLTPNDRDVIINPDVLLNGYPEVDYPVPFIQTNQLGYVIDPETFKFVDPSLIPYMEGPYPERLEIEYSTYLPLLEFYAENNQKLFSGFDLRFEYNFNLFGGKLPEWTASDDETYDYCDFSLFALTPNINPGTVWNEDSTAFKINFRFKLYWGDGKSHSSEIDWKHIIPSLNVYPFLLRITLGVNPDVINSMDTCFKLPLPDINNEPPKLNPNEPSLELVMEDVLPYLSHSCMPSQTYANTIINYLISSAADNSPYYYLSSNIARINFIKEYLRDYINNEAVDLCKKLLQTPHVLTYPYYVSQDSFSLSLYKDMTRQVTYVYTCIEENYDESGNVTYGFSYKFRYQDANTDIHTAEVFVKGNNPTPALILQAARAKYSDIYNIEYNVTFINNDNETVTVSVFARNTSQAKGEIEYEYGIDEDQITDVLLKYTDNSQKEEVIPYYKTWLYLPDSRDLFVRDLLTFKVEATFTHPTTFLSVNAMGNYTLQLKAYPGDRTGYIKMKYMDDYPLEVWSPYVLVIYGKSKKDEANVKVNKNLYTEYLGFIIDSSFHANEPKKYETYRYAKLYKKNILSAKFIDPSTGQEESVNEYNIDYFINLATSNSSFYNTYVNVIDIYDVSIGNYFNDYKGCDVYSDYDLNIFKNRWDVCKTVSVSTNKLTIYCLLTPKEQEEIFQHGLWDDSSHMFINTDLNVGISKYDVSFYGKYTAVYANYKIKNKDYYQIIKETHQTDFTSPVITVKFDCSTSEYPADFTRDYDITEYEFKNIDNFRHDQTTVVIDSGSYNQLTTHYNAAPLTYGANNNSIPQVGPNIVGTVTKRYEIEDETVSNYRVVGTDEGNTTLYKFCVNNLLYDGSTLQVIDGVKQKVDVQVPRFGVYGIYYGLFAYDFDVYDYETVKIPYIELSDYEDTNESNDVIIHSNSDIPDINGYIIDLSTGLHITGEVIDRPAIINVNIADPTPKYQTVYGANAPMKRSGSNILGAASPDNVYTIGPTNRYELKIYNIPPALDHALFVNGGKITLGNRVEDMYYAINNVKPSIFAIHLNKDYTVSQTFILDASVIDKFYTGEIEEYQTSSGDTDYRERTIDTPYNCHLLITNGENEKHFNTFDNEGHDIDTNLDSFMLLRTNPKLTGNIKLVVDTDYNIYLDTFKVSPKLANQRYRKQGIPADGNYPYDVKRIFATLPNTELFKVPENSLKAHKVYNDFNDQYETMYEYGAETNIDNLYNENMKILAPLHIGKDIPDFFTIFRYDESIDNGTFNDSNYKDIDKFKELLENAETVMTYDLREYTSIGQYLNNYKNMLTNYGQCYLQFIEEDNYKQSAMYRQGTNIWKGVSINRGILTNLSETTYFAEKILNNSLENKQETFNNFIMQGFERNNLLYPNILNIEFMFNDNSQDEYSMHRYFGLYLTENDFIKYGYIIPGQTTTALKKYDLDGNPYVGDVNIYHDIFTNDYRSRLFYAVTNDYADRVKSEIDIDNFLTNNVKNKPEKNMLNMKSDLLIFADSDKSFITLHLTEPLMYGEHIKIIAMNKPLPELVYNDLADVIIEGTVLPYEHIVFEIIASNNDALRKTSKFISPMETVNDCRYSENTRFYRISFYSQDISYPEISATLSEQIERIAACIKKFDSFIKVGSYNNNSISIISEHPEMYLQHIAAHDFDDFKYDYFNVQNNNFNPAGARLATTNKKYTSSIDFIPHRSITEMTSYIQTEDNENDWIMGRTSYAKIDSSWISYVEVDDPRNIKYENISYFNAFERFEMHALSNQSDYFDGYYAAFSNYGFESIGWRYNTVVKFIKTSELKNTYVLYDNKVYDFIKEIKYPIIMTDDNMYETICIFNIDNGYLRNNIVDPDIYEEYTSKQQFIFNTAEFQVISSPYDVNYSMVMSTGDALLKNNQVLLYKPKYANIAIMGISNVKDIDTIVDAIREIHEETKLTIYCTANEKIKVDESDYRILHGVMYELANGQLEAGTYIINSVSKFIILPTDDENEFKIYFENLNTDTANKEVISLNINVLQAKTDCEIKIIDRQVYQDYNYTTNIPLIQIKNLFKDINDIEHSELLYPITPLVNCNWKSNGQYFDFNNILDVSNISLEYEFIGNFVENTYTPALYNSNQYVTNKIDSIAFVDDEPLTFRNIILHNKILHPIKHFLIDNVNIDTAMAYYNSNIQSLEFIFSGVKFEIKLNSKLVNTYIHLDAYDNYEVFVINDYNISKRNEMFVSLVERFILLINHNFYIDYAHEAVNNIKTINDDVLKSWQEYSALPAPYGMNMKCTDRDVDVINGFTYRKSLHESLLSAIDPHNLWNSFFIQFDIPKLINNYDINDAQFIQSSFKSIYEYGNYMSMNNETDPEYEIGFLRWGGIDNISHFIDAVLSNNTDPYPLYKVDTLLSANTAASGLEHMFPVYTYWVLPLYYSRIPILYSTSFPFILTKADGDYNTLSKKLLKNINTKIAKLSKNFSKFGLYMDIEMRNEFINTGELSGVFGAPTPRPPHIDPSEHYSDKLYRDRFELKTEFNIMTMKHISDDDINITPNLNLFITYQDQNDYVMDKLSDILGTPIFMLIADEFRSNTYKNYYIPKPYLKKLQEYIEVLLVKETNYEKLKRYTKSINDNMDIYIITNESGVRYIQNTEYYNPLIFKLSIPNMIKYNLGWFTPNTVNMIEFNVDDKLTDILGIDLLQANTDVTNIYPILNYTGNKVYDDNRLYTLEKNYFIIPLKSLLETTWDIMHYRKYTDEENYIFQLGHETGIDDKSFFGSRCMVMYHEYILLDTWEYATANDILTYQITDSTFNVESTNKYNTEITINVTAAIFNHFINNRAFAENWNLFDNTQYTGMKNYIKNTLSSYYNMNSNIEVIVYGKDITPHEPINILTVKPIDINSYTIIEGIDVSEPDLKEDFYTITIKVPYFEGKNIYPNIKIYKK